MYHLCDSCHFIWSLCDRSFKTRATATSGAGKGGDLSIDAQDVQLIGTSADGQFSSGLYTSARPNSTGDTGNLTVKTSVPGCTFPKHKRYHRQRANWQVKR
ncbi:hypothetical protein [Nostoc sp.]|uniref:hypothetical protein n=1 Tax=Nostoc sp. TaxID=1180 RepID=UPI002FFAB6E3